MRLADSRLRDPSDSIPYNAAATATNVTSGMSFLAVLPSASTASCLTAGGAMPPEKEESHMCRFIRYAVAVFMAGLILAVPMQARIVRIDIQSTSAPASDGYVTITGRAYGEVDPTHPLNAII